MSRDIIKYTGPEIVWSTEDVYLIAENDDVVIKSHEDAVDILQAAFEGNQRIMRVINEEISDKIQEYYENA